MDGSKGRVGGVARRRGFFAELQHQQRLAQQRQAQQQRAAARAHNEAVRESQRFAREQYRLAEAAARATVAERAAAEHAARAAQVAANEAAVAEKNAALEATYDAIEDLLKATLEVDDWVDLESLRERVDNQPLQRPELLVQTPTPTFHPLPAAPVYAPPQAVRNNRLGGNRKLAAQVEAAQRSYADQRFRWEQTLFQTLATNADLRENWRRQEAIRADELSEAQRQNELATAARQRDVVESNARLDLLISGLQRREQAALDEYVGIVLANSVYPDEFQVAHEHRYNADDRELIVTVLAPHPDTFPTVKAFRYNKTSDEITSTKLAAAEVKRRYTSAITQLSLRTVHEVFEADREAIIDAVSLTIAVEATDRATGHDTRIDLVRLATDRSDFMAIDLSRVDPTATLAHLAAAVSKNPYGLVPVVAHGVRG